MTRASLWEYAAIQRERYQQANRGEKRRKWDPISLDTVWTTMTAAKEAGHEGQGAEADYASW